MRTALLAALLSSTAFTGVAFAQSQTDVATTVPAGQTQAKAASTECEGLILLLESRSPADSRTEQARALQQAGDAKACKDERNRIALASAASTSSPSEPPTHQVGYGTSLSATPVPEATGALAAAGTQPFSVSKLESMSLYNARNEKLGDVESVVSGPADQAFLVVTHGGFLGLGEKHVAVPFDLIALRGGHLLTDKLSDVQLRALPAFDRKGGYKKLAQDHIMQVRTRR